MSDQTTPAADWQWQDDPDVISWDWRQGPDLNELTALLARHGVTLTEVDTGTEDVAIRIGATPVEVLEDAVCRREWAAHRGTADRIESGTLTPWADSPEPATPPAEAAHTPPADPWATWDPSLATDEPDGLPDRAIVPLVESLRARGIVTLQSCIGHLAEQADGSRTGHDGGLWVQAASVDGAHIRLFMLREPFDRVQLVHWPERRWEFSWHPDDADTAVDALRGLLPAPAAPGPHPGILGRALMDRRGDVWWQRPGCPKCPPGSVQWWHGLDHATREEIDREDGPAREVLLVDPAAARVLAAARWCRDADNDGLNDDFDAAARELHAAVDALTGGQRLTWSEAAEQAQADTERAEARRTALAEREARPFDAAAIAEALKAGNIACVQYADRDLQAFAELPDCEACDGCGKQVPPGWYGGAEPDPTANVATTSHGLATEPAVIQIADGVHWLGEVSAATEPDPEPAGDGSGWDRPGIEAAENVLRRGGKAPGLADQLTALLAERDRLYSDNRYQAIRIDGLVAGQGKIAQARDGFRRQCDQARAELAEVTADLTQTTTDLAEVTAERNTAQADRTELASQVQGLRERLATARRDTAAATLDAFAELLTIRDLPGAASRAEEWAAEIRTGQRDTPGSPEQDGGGEDG